jgi:hypothetical protein
LRISIRSIVLALSPFFISSIFAALTAIYARLIISTWTSSPFIIASLLCVVFGSIYFLCVLLVARRRVTELVIFVQNIRNKRT